MVLIETCNKAIDVIKSVQTSYGIASVQEDDIFQFLPPEQGLYATLSELGYVGGSGFAPLSIADGDGLKKAILGKDARFIVAIKDQLNEFRVMGRDPIKVWCALAYGYT